MFQRSEDDANGLGLRLSFLRNAAQASHRLFATSSDGSFARRKRAGVAWILRAPPVRISFLPLDPEAARFALAPGYLPAAPPALQSNLPFAPVCLLEKNQTTRV
jgi:hypothetical protein